MPHIIGQGAVYNAAFISLLLQRRGYGMHGSPGEYYKGVTLLNCIRKFAIIHVTFQRAQALMVFHFIFVAAGLYHFLQYLFGFGRCAYMYGIGYYAHDSSSPSPAAELIRQHLRLIYNGAAVAFLKVKHIYSRCLKRRIL